MIDLLCDGGKNIYISGVICLVMVEKIYISSALRSGSPLRVVIFFLCRVLSHGWYLLVSVIVCFCLPSRVIDDRFVS